MLGNSDVALNRSFRLRANRGERGTSASSHRATATVKDLHRRAYLLEYGGEGARCLIQTPHRSEVAAILVGIGVTDHHFLVTTPVGGLTDFRQRQPRTHHLRCFLQIADRLEQGHHHDRGRRRLPGPVQSRFLQQQIHLEQVGNAFAF